MNIKKNTFRLISTVLSAGIIALSLTSCDKSEEPMPKSSGFLPHYTLLKRVSSPKGSQLYVYHDSMVKREDYHAVIVEPVLVYQSASTNGVSEKDLIAARDDLNRDMKTMVAKSIAVTETPGAGVATLSVAITGATVQAEGFTPLNIVPVSAAIKLASMATDLDSKTPAIVIELKFTDSVTGKSLLESLAVITGEDFRNRANTPKEFEELAKTWIQKDLQLSLDQR